MGWELRLGWVWCERGGECVRCALEGALTLAAALMLPAGSSPIPVPPITECTLSPDAATPVRAPACEYACVFASWGVCRAAAPREAAVESGAGVVGLMSLGAGLEWGVAGWVGAEDAKLAGSEATERSEMVEDAEGAGWREVARLGV